MMLSIAKHHTAQICLADMLCKVSEAETTLGMPRVLFMVRRLGKIPSILLRGASI